MPTASEVDLAVLRTILDGQAKQIECLEERYDKLVELLEAVKTSVHNIDLHLAATKEHGPRLTTVEKDVAAAYNLAWKASAVATALATTAGTVGHQVWSALFG